MITPHRYVLQNFIEESQRLYSEYDAVAERCAVVLAQLVSLEERLDEAIRKHHTRD